MADWKPTIGIVGAGAIGSYYGGRLAEHGQDVHFLLRSDYEAVRRNGLTVHSCNGDFTLEPGRIHVHNDPRHMPKADVVIITLKTTANDQYEQLVGPLVKDDTLVLTLQNGLGNEERLAELFGKARVLGGLAFVCVNRMAPGVIHHLDYGLIRVGEFVEGRTGNAERISQLFNQNGLECNVLQSLWYGRWEKLVWNVPFNGLGAVLDMATDRLLSDRSGGELVRRIMEEV
ncbi:MAG TPA: 2-dehydropantoate 2-reductase, partial [Tepidisphaeraceae bacterium]|nr:2-dehydropantoate 2-reductase [Tepidisphaeraceae bacterium]